MTGSTGWKCVMQTESRLRDTKCRRCEWAHEKRKEHAILNGYARRCSEYVFSILCLDLTAHKHLNLLCVVLKTEKFITVDISRYFSRKKTKTFTIRIKSTLAHRQLTLFISSLCYLLLPCDKWALLICHHHSV